MSDVLKPTLGSQLNLGHRLAQGLAGLWLFNEGAGNIVSDLSGNGYHGSLIADTHFVPGRFGSALDFDGTGDYVNIGKVVDLVSGAFSIVAMVKPSSFASYPTIIGGDGTGGVQFRFDNTGLLELLEQQLASIGKSNITSSVNDWVHIAITHNGANYVFYRNGIADGSGADATAFASRLTQIGTRSGGSDAFNGLIDHVLAYNRALSASEIAELSLRPFAMFDRTPIELWVGATSVGVPVANAPTSTIYGPLVGCLGGPI